MATSKLPLVAADLGNLRESGLSDETIRRNGLRTDNGSIVFPYRRVDGTISDFARRRLRKPRTDKDGKEIRYLQPPNSGCHAYFPAESIEALSDPTEDILIVEGEKKSLAVAQEGYCAVGLGGCWNWKKGGVDELIDELAEIPWEGRTVSICFDYDEKRATRKRVYESARRLARVLRAAGAKNVYWVEMPPGPAGTKQGADDFLLANGAEKFDELLVRAKPIQSATPSNDLAKPSGRTDTANAVRLVTRIRGGFRWVGIWDKWLHWDERRWAIDTTLRIEAEAKIVASELWKEIGTIVATQVVDSTTISAMVSFARSSNSANGIRNMVSLARSEPGIAIEVEQLDTDPWLLCVENGTVELRTGNLREHRREDFVTKLAPVVFDAKAECPVWIQFLKTIFADNAALIEYVQRLVGYTITGAQEEHILPFLYGVGANGKSTKCELLLKLMGPDYAMKGAPDLLMQKRGESHPTDRADLHGKRFVACVETESGRRMAESLVKELTGGDRIRARRMREDFWEFSPTHHVWLIGNHKPVVIGTDYGIWRRIKLIPFDVTIPDEKQDKQLGATLANELSGILRWAIEGCLAWQKDGMREPEIVRLKTTEYSVEMDDVGEFIETFCEIGEEFAAPATKLFELFREETGSSVSQKAFGAELRRRGFIKFRLTSGPDKDRGGWRGLRLRRDDTPPIPIRKGKGRAR